MSPEERAAHADRRMAEIEALAAEIGAIDRSSLSAVDLVREQRRY